MLSLIDLILMRLLATLYCSCCRDSTASLWATGTNGSTPEAPAAVSIVALGSQDGRLSVWRVDRDRPFMLAGRVFKHTVVDLAWTPDGYHLLACSMDGTVAAFHFDPGALTGYVGLFCTRDRSHIYLLASSWMAP